MIDVAALISELIAAGTPAHLVGKVAAAIAEQGASATAKDDAAERRRAYDRERKRSAAMRNSTGIPPETAEQPNPSIPPEFHRNSTGNGTALARVEDKPLTTEIDEQKKVKDPLTPKGTRLDPQWVLPRTWGEWALAEFPHLNADDVRRLGEDFRDYWVSVPGAKGRKADWQATWRNSVRMKAPPRGRPPPAGQPTTRDVVENRRQRLRERLEADGRFSGEGSRNSQADRRLVEHQDQRRADRDLLDGS